MRQYNSRLNIYLLFFNILVFLILAGYFLNNDFWQDEIYTVEHFVSTTWVQVLTDYHSTNNHIAFNLILKLVTEVFGFNSMQYILNYPYLLRCVPFFFSVLSIVILYRYTYKEYGLSYSMTAVSLLCSTIVFVDFAAQLRGYSMSIFLTIWQYFIFLKVMNKKVRNLHYILLFIICSLSLLCLPSNVYLQLAYFISCLIILFKPSLSLLFYENEAERKKVLKASLVLVLSMALVLLYYKWLISRQPENQLLTALHHFNIRNLVQALAIFYHFIDYRFYLYITTLLWLLSHFRYGTFSSFSKIVFPAYLFFIPFFLFFIHGPTIVQRIFITLLPFFILINASVIEVLKQRFYIPILNTFIYIANLCITIISFVALVSRSENANTFSQHKHDLRDHYYLINFNPKQIVNVATELVNETKSKLYLWDDFGGTGIEYYLRAYNVPFVQYYDTSVMEMPYAIITNNKKAIEKDLNRKGIKYKRMLDRNNQYVIYYY